MKVALAPSGAGASFSGNAQFALKNGSIRRVRQLGSSGDFGDSLAVFAVPKAHWTKVLLTAA